MDSTSHESGAGPDLKKARRHRSTAATVDRLPPHDPSMECGVLGCVLLSPNECLSECVEKLYMGSEVFYDLRHREIYETMVAMSELNVPIDVISLQQWLKDNGILEQVGGITYLSKLIDAVPSAANLSYYLQTVLDKFLLRKTIQTCTNVVGRIYDYEGDVNGILDEVEREILAIQPQQRNGVRDIKELVSEAIAVIENLYNTRGAISGLSTGLVDLDRLTDGLHRGEMIVVAAYPGLGKSTLAANIAFHHALQKTSSAFFTAEMQPVKIVLRAICAEAQVNLRTISKGFMAESDFPKMTSAAGRVSGATIQIENISGMTIQQVTALARRVKQKHNIQMAAVDYIQLLRNPDSDTREQEVSTISKGLKAIAMELGIPVLALSQLNDDGKLRESRAIGQDADCIWKIEAIGEAQSHVQPVKLSVEKSRDGEVGFVELIFQKAYTKFQNVSRVSDADVPAER